MLLLVKMGIIDSSVLSNLAVSFMHLAFHLRQIGIACTVKYSSSYKNSNNKGPAFPLKTAGLRPEFVQFYLLIGTRRLICPSWSKSNDAG